MAIKKKTANKHKMVKTKKVHVPTEKEIIASISNKIRSFLRDGRLINYTFSWNSLIPAYNKCMAKLDKYPTYGLLEYAIMLRVKSVLEEALKNGVRNNDPKYIFYGINVFIDSVKAFKHGQNKNSDSQGEELAKGKTNRVSSTLFTIRPHNSRRKNNV